MTRTRPTDRTAEFDEWRDNVVSSIGDFAQLADTPWEIVRSIECFPGSRLGDDRIVVPANWLPSGTPRRVSFRTVNLSLLEADGAELPGASQWNESLRRSILVLWLPRLTATGLRSYKPTSWLSSVYCMIRAAKWQRLERPHPDGLIWSHLSAADFSAMQAALWDGEQGRNLIRKIVRWLTVAGERGTLKDAPQPFVKQKFLAEAGANLERSAKGPAPVRTQKSEERNFKPFSDEYVSALLWRARWMQENLASQLLACWTEQRRMVADFAARGVKSTFPTVIAARRQALEAIDWRDANGRKIDRLPFKVGLPPSCGPVLI